MCHETVTRHNQIAPLWPLREFTCRGLNYSASSHLLCELDFTVTYFQIGRIESREYFFIKCRDNSQNLYHKKI